MIEKCCKHTKYKDSHQKNAKSEVKHLTRSSVPDTIFSNKQQATSNKQQATSNKQQATSNKQQSGINSRSAQINLQSNTNKFTHIKNRNARQALSFAQLRKAIIGMSYGLRQFNQKNKTLGF